MKTKTITLQIQVEVPIITEPSEVAHAIDEALCEGQYQQNDWGNWTVGFVQLVEDDDDDDDEGEDDDGDD